MPKYEFKLAKFISKLNINAIPKNVQNRARLVIADTLCAVIGGVYEGDVLSLAKFWSKKYTGSATILGTNYTASSKHAAFINGTAGCVLELDEGHKYAMGHPAIHILPSLLAEAEIENKSGERLLAAFVAGYESCARIAKACVPLEDSYHPHGVWGAIGAAAALSNLREFDAQTTLEAIRIAANFAQHTCFEAATEGATERNAYVGMSNISGIIAADLALNGFKGLENGIMKHLDRTTSNGFNEDLAIDGIGKSWEIMKNYFKIHSSCRYIHPTLDALSFLQKKYCFDPEDIEKITVETFKEALKLSARRPKNLLQARFSIPFAIAIQIIHGHSGGEIFDGEALKNELVLNLAEKVQIMALKKSNTSNSIDRSSRVTIKLRNGRKITHEVKNAKGDPENPLKPVELKQKFIKIVSKVLGMEKAIKLWVLIQNLPETGSAKLCASTKPKGGGKNGEKDLGRYFE